MVVTASLMAVTSPKGLFRIRDVVSATASPVLATECDVVSTLDRTFTIDGSAWITVLLTVRNTSDVWSMSGEILFSRDSSRLDNLKSTSVIDAITPILIKDPARYQMTRIFVAVELRLIELTI